MKQRKMKQLLSYLISKILGFRELLPLEAVKTKLVSKYLVDKDALNDLKHLLLFQTNAQTTWIIASREEVFCFLDDARKDDIILRWHDQIENIKDHITIDWDYNEKFARVDFSPNHKNWLVTKDNFISEEDFENNIDKLLSNNHRI